MRSRGINRQLTDVSNQQAEVTLDDKSLNDLKSATSTNMDHHAV